MVHSPPLPQALWRTLIDLAESSETAAMGSVLLQQGAQSRGLFLLETGTLRVDLPSGAQISLPGSNLVGEMSFLSGQEIRATVTCEDTCRLHQIRPDSLWAWIGANPTAGRRLLEALNILAMQRLRGQFHPHHYLALIAHDGRKSQLLTTARAHLDQLRRCSLLSTAHTGQVLKEQLDLSISRRVSSGPLGGDQEVGALVVAGLVQAVIFFPDPLSIQPHSADVAALLRLCDLCGVPLATNPGTADLLLTALTPQSQGGGQRA